MQGAIPGFSRLDGVEKFAAGQSNPTYRITTANGNFVLRRKPFGKPLPSAHSVEREFRLLAAIHPTGFPVPRPIVSCNDVSVIGAVFYLMEMVEGRIFGDGMLPNVPKADRRAHYEAMIDTMAALHLLDPETPGLADFRRPGIYIQRQVERWTHQYRASVVHGDYRIDNLIYAPGAPQVLAVLDWELATIGDPLADFTYLAMSWVMPRDGRSGLIGVNLEEAGLPTLDEVVARYCDAAGRARLEHLC
jgi:aminoglycoside phosphotransferase (APT) family kinase protein